MPTRPSETSVYYEIEYTTPSGRTGKSGTYNTLAHAKPHWDRLSTRDECTSIALVQVTVVKTRKVISPSEFNQPKG